MWCGAATSRAPGRVVLLPAFLNLTTPITRTGRHVHRHFFFKIYRHFHCTATQPTSPVRGAHLASIPPPCQPYAAGGPRGADQSWTWSQPSSHTALASEWRASRPRRRERSRRAIRDRRAGSRASPAVSLSPRIQSNPMRANYGSPGAPIGPRTMEYQTATTPTAPPAVASRLHFHSRVPRYAPRTRPPTHTMIHTH